MQASPEIGSPSQAVCAVKALTAKNHGDGHPPPWLSRETLDRLVSVMDVQVIALSECVVGPGFVLDLGERDVPSFHYIREGRGRLHWPNGAPAEIGPQMLVIVPPKCRFRFEPVSPSGPAQALNLPDRAGTGVFMLCGIFRSLYGNSVDLFDTLDVPVIEQFSKDDGLEARLRDALAELVGSNACSDVLVSTAVKQVIIALIRRSLRTMNGWTRRFAVLSAAEHEFAHAPAHAGQGELQMNQSIILHSNVTRGTLQAIKAAFGATCQLRQLDERADIAREAGTERVALLVIGVGDGPANLPADVHAPVILIAREPNTDQELQALQAGAADYISCAVPAPVLTARLRNHLSGGTSRLRCYIRELELQQKKNLKLTRALATLSRTNAAIARLRERSVLFNETARIAVEQGGCGAAWIALRDRNERFVIIASNGFSNDDLPALDLLLAGGGMIQNCIRSAAVEIRNATSPDCVTDAECADASDRGFGSLAIVPLKPWDQVEGVMGLYASEEGFFDDKDTSLLFELGQDLSFALRNFEQRDRANYLYYYDVLTGLPNFSLFLDRLTQVIYTAYSRELGVYVLVANLAHFKHINEVWGRLAGDRVLEIIAQRLRTGLPEQASIARVEGDGFAVADLYSDNADLALLIERVRDIIEEPIQLEERTLRLSARMGCATSPEDGEDSEVVFRNAEAALKHARRTGVHASFYSRELNAHVSARLEMESFMRSAVGTDQFVMHYQPKVDVGSGEIVAAEALIRWQHPEMGKISPADFIPLAEDTGLIIPLGRWVIDTVCAQQSAWRRQGVPIVPVALNLSALQFKGSDVLKDVQAALVTHGVGPDCIELELTESLVMQDPAAAEATMRSLRAAGLSLSLDDFGTGYSSLAYLKRFPFSSVKIDRAFVTDITTNPGDAAIAKAIIGMGHSLQLKVIAEGVETAEQLELLRESGCDQVQGFYFSRPLPADEFGEMLRARKHIVPGEQSW